MFKQVYYFFLIFLMFIQSGGLLMYFYVHQCIIHFEMQQIVNCNQSQFEKISISVNQFCSSKVNNHEIILNGKMYDIKSSQHKGNIIELLVVNDIKEENIIKKIKNAVNAGLPQDNRIPNHLIKLLTLTFINIDQSIGFLFSEVSSIDFCPLNEFIVFQYSEICSPPPELV